MKQNIAGFTLIELMVVMTVMAILSTIVIYGAGKAQQSATDARRVQIMTGLQGSLERYYQDYKFYPAGNFGQVYNILLGLSYVSAITDPKSSCNVNPPASGSWIPCTAGSPPTYAYVSPATAANCPSSSTAAGQGYELRLTPEAGGVAKYFCSP